jgi:hypothetical protein
LAPAFTAFTFITIETNSRGDHGKSDISVGLPIDIAAMRFFSGAQHLTTQRTRPKNGASLYPHSMCPREHLSDIIRRCTFGEVDGFGYGVIHKRLQAGLHFQMGSRWQGITRDKAFG